MHLSCSSPPPRRFSLFPPLCSLPCYPLPLPLPPPCCSLLCLAQSSPLSSFSLRSSPVPFPAASRLSFSLSSFAASIVATLSTLQHRYLRQWGGGAPRDPYGTSKLVALKLYTGARETAIASHFQHMACGPLARFRGRYRTLWIVRRIAFREMFVVSVSSDRQSSFKGSLGTQTQGPYLGTLSSAVSGASWGALGLATRNTHENASMHPRP